MAKSTLFIDESGKSSLLEKDVNPFIMTGVILDEAEVNKIEGFFNYIKRKFDINADEPFHSYHLFEHPKTRVTDKQGKDLSKTLGEFISLIPIRIRVVAVKDKSQFKKILGVRTEYDLKSSSEKKMIREFPYRILSAEMFKWFAQYLGQNHNIGQIIADSRKGGNYHLLKNLEDCKDQNGPLSKEESYLIKERCTAICFADKNYLSGGLEITDLISYVSFFHIRRQMKSMENMGVRSIWNQIKPKLEDKDIKVIEEGEIRKFFKLKKDEVHKYLKS